MRKGKDKATLRGLHGRPDPYEGRGEPDPKVRKCDIQPLPSGKDRRLHWRIQHRKQW